MRFDSRLEIFRHHFPENPVVPGAIVLASRVAQIARSPCRIKFRDVRFRSFLGPDEDFSFAIDERGQVRAQAGEKTCCTFFESSESVERVGVESQAFQAGDFLSNPIQPLRSERFWFLPDDIEFSKSDLSARCKVSFEGILKHWSYLQEVEGWRHLLLAEILGNMALVLNSRADATHEEFVFVQFGAIEFDSHLEWIGAAEFEATTRLRRSGSLLVWDAAVVSGGRTVMKIFDAVSKSTKRKKVSDA